MNADYAAYINSSKWKSLSTKIRNRDGNKCRLCDALGTKERSLDVHHLTYVRLGKERHGDLVTLCQHCHAEQHKLAESLILDHPKLSRNLALGQAWDLSTKTGRSLNYKLKKAEKKRIAVERKKELAEMKKAHIDSLKRLGRIDENGKRISKKKKKKKDKKSPIVKTIKVPRNVKVPN